MSFIVEQSRFNLRGETAPALQCKKVSQVLGCLDLGAWHFTKKWMVKAELKENEICDWDVLISWSTSYPPYQHFNILSYQAHKK